MASQLNKLQNRNKNKDSRKDLSSKTGGNPGKQGLRLDDRYTIGALKTINIQLIVPNPKNIRESTDENLSSLIESIKELGLQQNLVVYQEEKNKYKILSGHRRYAALKALNEKYPEDMRYQLIPCLVTALNEDQEHDISSDLTEKMLIATTNVEIETLSRKELLHSVLVCEEYFTKKNNGGKSAAKDDIAAKLKLSRKSVYNLLNFNTRLIPEFRSLYFDQELLQNRSARYLISLDEPTQKRIFEHFKDHIDTMNESKIKAFLKGEQDLVKSLPSSSDKNAALNAKESAGKSQTPVAALTEEDRVQYQYRDLPENKSEKIQLKDNRREFILPNKLHRNASLEIDPDEDLQILQPLVLHQKKYVLKKTTYRKYAAAMNQISKQLCIIADLMTENSHDQ